MLGVSGVYQHVGCGDNWYITAGKETTESLLLGSESAKKAELIQTHSCTRDDNPKRLPRPI